MAGFADDDARSGDGQGFCSGCGRPADGCAGGCGRAHLAHFCGRCGRRMQEIAVNPGLVERRCRDHGSA